MASQVTEQLAQALRCWRWAGQTLAISAARHPVRHPGRVGYGVLASRGG